MKPSITFYSLDIQPQVGCFNVISNIPISCLVCSRGVVQWNPCKIFLV